MLARELAAAGHATLRFDYRGMGDSDGAPVSFEEAGEDIRAALDLLSARREPGEGVVLWGFCDGASAASFHAAEAGERIAGLVLVNPWVRSDRGLARTRIRQHYRQRLLSREFWGRLFAGKVRLASALGGIFDTALAAAKGAAAQGARRDDPGKAPGTAQELPEKVAEAILAFQGRVLLILSGDDETAREFETTVLSRAALRAWRERRDVAVHWIEGANHTYSRREWRQQVHNLTLQWLKARRPDG